MNNKETIKHVYDEIHAPDALFGKVMEMNKKESKARYAIKYAVCTAAALAVAFVTSNGVCYATIGETWVSKRLFISMENGQSRKLHGMRAETLCMGKSKFL